MRQHPADQESEDVLQYFKISGNIRWCCWIHQAKWFCSSKSAKDWYWFFERCHHKGDSNSLYKTFSALKENVISQTTIGRLFQAPNQHFRAAKRYTALINARVGTKAIHTESFIEMPNTSLRDVSYHLFFRMIYPFCLLRIWQRLKLVPQQ